MTRFTALLLTVLTGFTGLVYEVTWQKLLATLLGSHAEATAAVLAIFLGGLSVGYALFGAATRRLTERARHSGIPPRLLRFYGLIEAAIGVYALLFPALFGLAQSISLLAPFHAGLAFAFDVLLTVLLIGPPAALMGGTIPILTLALAGDLQHATRVHAQVYGFNTAGAFAGALIGGFFLVPLLGLDGVLYAMGALNLFAGAVFVALDRLGAPVAPDLVGGGEAARGVEGFAGYAAVALLGGFAMMAFQTTLNRVGGLAFGASHFTFAMVVAVFVLCIALGSLAVSTLRRISPLLIVGSQWLLVLLLIALYFRLPDSTYYAHLLRMVFRNHYIAFYPYHFAALACGLLVLLVPIGLSGALLPLLFHHLRREVGTLGSIAGRLYSWNTIGSLLGALLGGYVLLFWLELHQVYSVAVAAMILAAGILTVLVARVSPIAVALLVVLPGIAGLASLPEWEPARMAAGLFRMRAPHAASFSGPDGFFGARNDNPVIFHTDDPITSVTVREGPRMGTRLNRTLFTNGKSDGNLITDQATMALNGLLPALMAEKLERCYVIGFGLGVTTGELAALNGTREVHVAEISQGVIDAAPLFDEGNLRASRSPKVVFHRSDAYRALLRSEGKWDVIASEPSNPWVTGVEMLYSVDFLEAVRERLAPGGVFAQWFHLYELDEQIAALVLRNYAAAFPHVSVWFTMSNDVLLLAFDRPGRAMNLDALEARYRQPDFAAAFERLGVESFAALLAHEQIPLGTLQSANLSGELHTLRHPILSHLAARAFFRGEVATIPKFVRPRSVRIGTSNSLLLRYAKRRGGIGEDLLEAATRETCRLARAADCATFFAYWRRTHPDSMRLSAALGRARRPDPKQPLARESFSGITEPKLADLEVLFGAKTEVRGRPLQRAIRLTTDYVTHFHYAVPFERRTLEEAWAKCTGPPCEPALRVAQQEIGPLAGQRAQRAEPRAPAPR